MPVSLHNYQKIMNTWHNNRLFISHCPRMNQQHKGKKAIMVMWIHTLIRQQLMSKTSLMIFLLFLGISQVKAATLVALLPMTGTQALAGKEIAKALQNQLNIKHKLIFVDRHRYSDFASAWETVMQHKPDLVVGPIAMEDVAELILSQPSVPTIALNRLAESALNVWQIGLSLEYTAIQLAETLREQGHERALLLIHDSPTAERSWKAFLAAWNGNLVDVASFSSLRDIKQANRRLLHSSPSIERIKSLRNVLQNKAEASPWVRQDADVLMMISPLHEAIELSFRTDHVWSQGMSVYWLDSGQQPVDEFVATSVNWGRMHTLMSPYLIHAMQRTNDVQPEQNFFRALGHDGGLLANLMFDQQLDQLTSSDGVAGKLGKLSLQAGGKIGIELSQVWLGGGTVEAVE